MRFIVTIICVLLMPLASAQNLVEFENGQVADANDLNANLNLLLEKIEALEGRVLALEPTSSCLSLSQVGDGVRVGNQENQFNIQDQTTISGWVKITGACTDVFARCEILSLEQTNSGAASYTSGITLYISPNDRDSEELQLTLRYFASDAQSITYASLADVALDDWMHVAGVRDANSVNLYINGALAASYTDEPIGDIDFFGGAWDHSNTWIGKAFPNGLGSSVKSLFVGNLSRIGLWTTPLTGDDISQMYGDEFDYLASNPAGFWPLDESAGNIARDASAFTNDGILEGNASWAQNCF